MMVLGKAINSEDVSILLNAFSATPAPPEPMSPATLEFKGLATEDANLNVERARHTSASPRGGPQRAVRHKIGAAISIPANALETANRSPEGHQTARAPGKR
eukprot:6087860-Pyramimonas_sp.AAC.1